jgi:hypothetical protein
MPEPRLSIHELFLRAVVVCNPTNAGGRRVSSRWKAAMMKRHVFATTSLPIAEAVVCTAREHGVGEGCICLEARSDVERAWINDERKNVSMDFIPAAWHGTLGGAAAGFLIGLIALMVPHLGVTFAVVMVTTMVGALMGTFASALVGSTIPDEVRRKFRRELEAGQILVVIDAEPEAFAALESDIARAGGRRLSFESNTALT